MFNKCLGVATINKYICSICTEKKRISIPRRVVSYSQHILSS